MSDSSSSPRPTDWRATLARLVRPRRPWLLAVVAVTIVVVVVAAVVLYPAVFAE
jgi:negative regulator of sigma E activity